MKTLFFLFKFIIWFQLNKKSYFLNKALSFSDYDKLSKEELEIYHKLTKHKTEKVHSVLKFDFDYDIKEEDSNEI